MDAKNRTDPERNLSSTERVDSDHRGQRPSGAGLTCFGVQGVSTPLP